MRRRPVRETVTAGRDIEDRRRRISASTRRAQILTVARKLFAARGFLGTTTKQIAQEAGVTEALLFQHFPSKRDLYNSILERKAGENPVEPVLASLRSFAQRRDDRGFFEEYARSTLARYRVDGEFLRLMLYSALEGHELASAFRSHQVKPIQTELRRYIAARQQEGAFRKMPIAAAVRAFAGAIGNYALVKEIFGTAEAGLSEKQAILQFADLFLRGVTGSGV